MQKGVATVTAGSTKVSLDGSPGTVKVSIVATTVPQPVNPAVPAGKQWIMQEMTVKNSDHVCTIATFISYSGSTIRGTEQVLGKNRRMSLPVQGIVIDAASTIGATFADHQIGDAIEMDIAFLEVDL